MQTPPHATRAQLVTFLNLANERALLALLKNLGLAVFGRTVPWPRVWEAIGLQGDQPAGLHASLMSPLLTATDLAADFGVSAETVHRARREGREGMPPAILLGPRRTRWLREEIRAWQGLRPDPGYRRLTAPVPHPPIAEPLRFGALPGAGPNRAWFGYPDDLPSLPEAGNSLGSRPQTRISHGRHRDAGSVRQTPTPGPFHGRKPRGCQCPDGD